MGMGWDGLDGDVKLTEEEAQSQQAQCEQKAERGKEQGASLYNSAKGDAEESQLLIYTQTSR
jgi:hypothetical protein